MIKFKQKLEFCKICICELDSFLVLTIFFLMTLVVIDKCKLGYHKIKQKMSTFGQSTSLNEPMFSKWPMNKVTKSCISKCPFKMYDRLMDFSISQSKKKFIDVVLGSTLQLTLKKLLLIEFWCNIKEEFHNYIKRLLKCSFLSQLHIYVKLDFLYLFQSK